MARSSPDPLMASRRERRSHHNMNPVGSRTHFRRLSPRLAGRVSKMVLWPLAWCTPDRPFKRGRPGSRVGIVCSSSATHMPQSKRRRLRCCSDDTDTRKQSTGIWLGVSSRTRDAIHMNTERCGSGNNDEVSTVPARSGSRSLCTSTSWLVVSNASLISTVLAPPSQFSPN